MTEDEADKLIETMFDEVKEVHVEMVNGKPRVTDEETIAQMDAQEMESAVAELTQAWRRFREYDRRHPDAALDPEHGLYWWRLAEYLMLANNRTKDAFLGRHRDPASVRQHDKFRRKMLLGQRYRTDA
jgi:hypothetical protein